MSPYVCAVTIHQNFQFFTVFAFLHFVAVVDAATSLTPTPTLTPTVTASPSSSLSPTSTFTNTILHTRTETESVSELTSTQSFTNSVTFTQSLTKTQTLTSIPTKTMTSSCTTAVVPTSTSTATCTVTHTETTTFTLTARDLTTDCDSACIFDMYILADVFTDFCGCPTFEIDNTLILLKDTEMHLDAFHTLVFGETFHAVLSFMFNLTGPASTTTIFRSNTSLTIQKGFVFVGPTVIISGVMILTNSSTSRITAGSVTFNISSVVNITSGSVIFFQNTSFITGRNSTMTGAGGMIRHQAGYVKFIFMIIDVSYWMGASPSAQRRPSALPIAYLCGNKMANVTIQSGTMNVDMSCSAPETAFSMTATAITIQSGSVLYLGNVSASSRPISISTSFVWNSGGWISVDLPVQPKQMSNNSNSTYTIIRFPAFNCVIPSGANAEAVAVGYTMSGIVTILATSDPTSVGICLIQVSWVASLLSAMSPTFVILLNQECAVFTAAAALRVLSSFYDSKRLTVSTQCASTVMYFACSGSDVPSATAYCRTIYNDITNPNSQLYALLNPILWNNNNLPAGAGGSANSKCNTALLGLLVLLVIPVILVMIGFTCYKRRKFNSASGAEVAYRDESNAAPAAASHTTARTLRQQDFVDSKNLICFHVVGDHVPPLTTPPPPPSSPIISPPSLACTSPPLTFLSPVPSPERHITFQTSYY